MIFKDFHECKMVVLEWENIFNNNDWNKIKIAIIHAEESPIDDTGKCWLVQNALLDALWDNDDATNIGYSQWIRKQKNITLDMLQYYIKNPEEELQ